ncbi:hypothetical protein L208DRAFT_1041158, partial [Tricholoma matsutake]
RPTDTLPTRTIHHETQAAICQLMAYIQTREQLDQLLKQYDPPVIHRKGRPLTQHLIGALEGRPRGGGARHHSEILAMGSQAGAARRQLTRCGICREAGHNQTTCPL